MLARQPDLVILPLYLYTSNMLDSGASEKDVQEALGHASFKMTAHYAHGNRQRRRTASLNLDMYVSGAN